VVSGAYPFPAFPDGTATQWLLLGGESGNPDYPVRLIACAKLWDPALSYDPPVYRNLADDYPAPAGLKVHAALSPNDTVMIDAVDWQTALAELWRRWSPEHGKTTPGALPGPPPQIGGPP